MRNNPVNLTDPTGHRECGEDCNQSVPTNPWDVSNELLDTNGDGTISFIEEESLFDSYSSQADEIFLNSITPPIHRQITYGGYGGCKTIDDRTCSQHHPAVDSLDENDGGEVVFAIQFGTVVYVGEGNAFGNYIIIEHDVYGTLYYSVYAHLNRTDVKEGDVVGSMTAIGLVGGSGTGGEPPHLHLEVRRASTVDLNAAPGTSPLGNTYWANSPEDLEAGWLDLGPIFGYHNEFNTWND